MADPYTAIGGSNQAFPQTRWSLVQNAQDPKSSQYQTSLEELAAFYWKPVYGYFRRKWNKSNDEAKDLTQEFFATLCEKVFLRNASPDVGRFRTYIMAALDNFARVHHRDANRLKRGGGVKHFALNMTDEFDIAGSDSPETAFMREWASCVLKAALDKLEREYKTGGREVGFKLLMEHDINASPDADLSYEALAKRFRISVSDVTYLLYRARRDLREALLSQIRDTVSHPDEAEAELRALFENLQ